MSSVSTPSSRNDVLTSSDINQRLQQLQQTVSASRLNCFLQCRLKFNYRYVEANPKPKTPALHVGNTVHSVLKAWHKARWLNSPMSLKQLYVAYIDAWEKPESDQLLPVQWDGDEENAKLTGWRLCEVYLRENGIDIKQKPDAVEVSVEADLARHGLPKLIGILDLVQRHRIIDYKTTSSTPQADKVAHQHEIQTSIYAVLYRHNTGDQESGIELHHLVKLKSQKLCITQLPSMSQNQQTRLFRILEAYANGLDGRDFVPSPGMVCASCEYFNECRQWH